MSSIKIKSFFDHKRGVSYWDGADRSAMNLERGRFAVADGVSQSFLPNLWAEILCDSFVNSDAEAEEDWIGNYSKSQLAADCQLWRERSEETLKNANDDEAFLLQLSKDEYKYAGSTLAGIVIKGHSLFYNVLGDSCLFVFDKEKKKLASYSTINEQEGFTTAPDYFFSAGKVVGQWKHGSIPLKPGYVMLMTDALSEWLTKEYAENPALLEQLWALDSHEAFMELVENARETDAMKDDDVALMMLQIEDGYDILYCDTMESLVAQQKADDNNPIDQNDPETPKEDADDNEEIKPETDEQTIAQEESLENNEEISIPGDIVDSTHNIDNVSECHEEQEIPKPDESDNCSIAASDNEDVSAQSQEEDTQALVEDEPLEQKHILTENEGTNTSTGTTLGEKISDIKLFCPHCGWRYSSESSSFCTKCGHPKKNATDK